MKKLNIWAGRLLVLQLVIVIFLYFGSIESQTDFKPGPLLAFNKDAVDKIIIASDKDQVTLKKDQGKWVLSDTDNFPVKPEKLSLILDKLINLKSTQPVTTTASSHERFDVAENKFKRKIQLYAHDKLTGELYLGRSPGFKKNYLRVPGSDNVYALGINVYDFPVNAIDWLNKQLLAIKNIHAINGSDFKLTKTGEKWQLFKPEKEESALLDENRVNRYIKALETFNVLKLAQEKPDFTSDKAISIQVQSDKDLTYKFTESKGKFYVNRSDNDSVFSLSPFEYQRLTGVSFSEFTIDETESNEIENTVMDMSSDDESHDDVDNKVSNNPDTKKNTKG